ncbi:hypothetical protein GS910_22175 [Paraburkholderia sp. RL16-012-BIC-B]|uniref:hypothetical protein n=1 Tax=Paraburkholderia madseniana TaxID=2599607 RepID=UPI0015C5450F|nr:hypothetical protein [Paraburkholderia madseniana]
MLHVAEPQSSGTYQGTRSRPVNQSRNEAPGLSRGQPEPFRRPPRLEPAVGNILNDLEPVEFAHRHRYPFGRSHQCLQRRVPAAGQHTHRKSGHLNLAKSGHYRLATTITDVDNLYYVKQQALNDTITPNIWHEGVFTLRGTQR